MKPLRYILFFPPSADGRWRRPHQIWVGFGVTALGCCVGLLTLLLACTACVRLEGGSLMVSYLKHPLLLVLNFLPPVLLSWIIYLFTGRAWVGYLGGAIPCLAIALVNYYKIRLRGDPLLGADLLLAGEAKGIVGQYTLDVTWVVWVIILCFLAGLVFAVIFLPRGVKSKKVRFGGGAVCLALLPALLMTLYASPKVYAKTANTGHINPWSDVEVYVSKGVLYPFLYSLQDMFPKPPTGYEEKQAARILSDYTDADIPDGKKVSVVGIMLEAFCDLTDYPILSAQPGVQQVYKTWHEMEGESVHGDLLTNIFAGGTVDSEWCFLTGYSRYDQFRTNTDSYVWYLRHQGYDTTFHHPGHGWFYNRQNVNEYLGFEQSFFTDNRFGAFVDPVTAVYHSDNILTDVLLEQVATQPEGQPLFSFSVSYQNHGPYETASSHQSYLTPAATGWSEESCHILNNYLYGLDETIQSMDRLRRGLEEQEEPIVLVLFGDHKPWLGNGDSVYRELGVSFDMSTLEGFENYYATPYLIWANSAAKAALGEDFAGEGGDFSPCFLMTKLFDLCAWDGPGFMQLGREMRLSTPLVHNRGMYLSHGALTMQPPDEALLDRFLWAQYYRETQMRPQS